MTVLDCRGPDVWGPALDEAVNALRRGEVVAVPTDAGYGLAADAFDLRAVDTLAGLKDRPGETPVGVLVPEVRTLDGLCTDVPGPARDLAQRWWPGPLTLVCRAQPSLAWDLGETEGTVAVRVPAQDALLALLRRTGPLAVTGLRQADGSAVGTAAAVAALVRGGALRLTLDAGELEPGVPSTVVDATTSPLLLLRPGPVGLDELREVADVQEPVPGGTDEPGPDEAGPDEAGPDEGGAVEPGLDEPGPVEPGPVEPGATGPGAGGAR